MATKSTNRIYSFSTASKLAQQQSVHFDGSLAVIEREDWVTETLFYEIVDYDTYAGNAEVLAIFSKGFAC